MSHFSHNLYLRVARFLRSRDISVLMKLERLKMIFMRNRRKLFMPSTLSHCALLRSSAASSTYICIQHVQTIYICLF